MTAVSLSGGKKRTDELLDRLVLDIKAVVLLHGSEGTLRSKVGKELIDSHDEEVRRFVAALQTERRARGTGMILIGLGELVFASFLVIGGTIAFMPALTGITAPGQLLEYLAGQLAGVSASSALYRYAAVAEFVIGAGLLLAAFYTLREAAGNLREAGLSVDASDE